MRNVRRYLAREEKLRNSKSNLNDKPKDIAKNTASTTSTMNVDRINDEETCAFRPENYRNLLVVNNGDHVFFYRHHRPTNVKQTNMTDIKRRKFLAWTTQWYNDLVSSNQVAPKRK